MLKLPISSLEALMDHIYTIPKLPEEEHFKSKPSESTVLIILREDEWKSEEIALLEKILSALKLSIESCAVVALKQNEKISLSSDVIFMRTKNVILFGLEPRDVSININLKKNVPTEFSDKNYLCSHSIQEIALSQELKAQLWKALQNIFL